MSLVSVLILPVVLIWDVMTRPGAAQSAFIFELYLLVLLILIFLGYQLYKILTQPQLPIGGKSVVLFMFVLFLLLTSDELAKENANRGHVMILSDKAELIRAQLEDKRTAGVKVTPDPVFGEQVYKNHCAQCHAFDHKVVGPPHNEVLPKYKNDLDTLRKFIKNPWKVNPNLPQMPAQPLNKKELESVIAYMMKHIESVEKTQK